MLMSPITLSKLAKVSKTPLKTGDDTNDTNCVRFHKVVGIMSVKRENSLIQCRQETDGGDTERLMIAARDNLTQSLFLDRSHNKLSCHIKISISFKSGELQQKLKSDTLYPINIFLGPLTFSTKRSGWKIKYLFFFLHICQGLVEVELHSQHSLNYLQVSSSRLAKQKWIFCPKLFVNAHL